MSLETNIAIQKTLKNLKLYTDVIDGKFGPKSLTAIEKWIRSYNVNVSGWNKYRLTIAAEQLLYKVNKIEVGIIDGYEHHNLEQAREVWKAKLVLEGRDAIEELVPELKESGVIKAVPVKVTPVRTWPRQKEVASFYGRVGTNQVDAVMPFPMKLAWNTKSKLTKFSVHKLVKTPIERVFNRTFDHYGYEKIRELRLDLWGGCLNVRKKRGGSSYSMHSWGIAVDMDPEHNGFHTKWKNAGFSAPAYKPWIKFWYEEGAINLGIEANFDPMHFQFARL